MAGTVSAPPVVARSLDGRTRWGRVWPLPFQLWFPLMVYGVSRLIAAAYMVAAAAAMTAPLLAVALPSLLPGRAPGISRREVAGYVLLAAPQ